MSSHRESNHLQEAAEQASSFLAELEKTISYRPREDQPEKNLSPVEQSTVMKRDYEECPPAAEEPNKKFKTTDHGHYLSVDELEKGADAASDDWSDTDEDENNSYVPIDDNEPLDLEMTGLGEPYNPHEPQAAMPLRKRSRIVAPKPASTYRPPLPRPRTPSRPPPSPPQNPSRPPRPLQSSVIQPEQNFTFNNVAEPYWNYHYPVYTGVVTWWSNLSGKGQLVERETGEARTVTWRDIQPVYGALFTGHYVKYQWSDYSRFQRFWVKPGQGVVRLEDARANLLEYPYLWAEIPGAMENPYNRRQLY